MSIESSENFKPVPRHSLGGELNTNFHYTDEQGKLYLRRVPGGTVNLAEAMREDAEKWGLQKVGVTLVPRSPQEQIDFEMAAKEKSLRVLPLTTDGSGTVYRPLLDRALTLDTYSENATVEEARRVLRELFEDALRAHQSDIVYGDRWPKNILVDPELGLVHIDFDFRAEGPAKEFELAQLIFYSFALYPKCAVDVLLPLLMDTRAVYDFEIVKKIALERTHFGDKNYADTAHALKHFFRELESHQES